MNEHILPVNQYGEQDTLESGMSLIVMPQHSNVGHHAIASRSVEITELSPVAEVAQPMHFYPKASLALQKLKCPTLRSYCETGLARPFTDPLRSGLNRTLALFEAGQETAMAACGTLPDFDQGEFDESIATGRLPDTPRYSCQQSLADGSSTCPSNGCALPDGSAAYAPTDLLNWDCNIREVGQTVIAKSIVTGEFGSELVNMRDKLFAPEEGIYAEVDEGKLYSKIIGHLGPMGTMKQISDIGKIIRIQHVRRMEVISPDTNFICFNNGTLNVITRQLEPHNAAHMLLNRIEHDYIPDARCLQFLEFLNSVWQPDIDRGQKIRCYQQWLGYLLVPDPSMQKMLILKGEGANGKSVKMDITRHIVGEKNTTSAMLDRLRLPHVRATMENKLLNQSADLPKIGIVADGDMKALISGDAIEVSPKFKPSYTIKPYARLMVATNNLPNSRDTTEGYFRRIIILEFNRQFSEQERDPRLFASLVAETPGIIAWAVQGLYDLREQGSFTIPDSSAIAVQRYREDISPVRLFAEECLVPSSDRSGFTSRDLFMAFRSWCRDRGFDAGNMVSLGRELSTLGFTYRKSSNTLWLIKVKESGQDYFKPAQIITAPNSLANRPLPSSVA
jgi:putative DNA primase/helicase